MRIGIGLPNQVRDVDAALLPSWAAEGERAGFSTLAAIGRIAYPGVMDTIALACAAGATSTIGLLTGVFIAPAWPPEIAAKELAGIDGVSGHRLVVGVGLGARPDDFLVPDRDAHGLGKRLDADLDTFRRVWDGERVRDVQNPLVPAGTRRPPILIGGFVPASYRRVARVGDGYISGTVPPEMVAPSYEAVRSEWRAAGRAGEPRLWATAYSALGDPDAGRRGVHDYYSASGPELAALTSGAVSTTVEELRSTAQRFADLGVEELVVESAVADPEEIQRIAESLL